MEIIQVIVTDDRFSETDNPIHGFEKMHRWAWTNCGSYMQYKITDVSDLSIKYDYVAVYDFTDPNDVVHFKLRWG